jgi:hypothetical protein
MWTLTDHGTFVTWWRLHTAGARSPDLQLVRSLDLLEFVPGPSYRRAMIGYPAWCIADVSMLMPGSSGRWPARTTWKSWTRSGVEAAGLKWNGEPTGHALLRPDYD